MKRNYSILFAAICFVMVSCTVYETTSEHQLDIIHNYSHTIPVDEALSKLDAVLSIVDEGTKGEVKRRVKDVNIVRASYIMTKAEVEKFDCDSLMYIINFEDEEGYAVLAADDRIPEDIIVLMDKGQASVEDYEISTESRPLYAAYPIDGPGVFLDECGEGRLNPNTFQLYDEAVSDYYVGDLIIEEFPTKSTMDVSDNQMLASKSKLLNDMVIDYVLESVRNPEEDNKNTEHTFVGKETMTYDYVIKTENVSDTVVVDRLLKSTYDWHQSSPFNNRCPMRGSGDNKKHTYVGCVPLAVAKIMLYAKTPKNFEYEKETIFITDTLSENDKSILCRYVGKGCGSFYFSEGTFTFPAFAKSFMRSNGFTNVEYTDYSNANVISHLDNSCPVLIFSVPKRGFLNYDLQKSHGWVIDGYLKRVKTITSEYYLNKSIVRTDDFVTYDYLVHCDFGWSTYKVGRCNGYFASGVFNLGDTSDNTIFDDSNDISFNDTNYNWYLKTITYGDID